MKPAANGPISRNPGACRRAALALGLALMAGCGGGGGSSSVDGAMATVDSRVIASTRTQTNYPLSIYLPPASAGARSTLPVIVVLDGESWFQTVIGIVETSRTPAIVVAVGSAGQRNRDFVPANTCTPGGGGEAAYLDFLRSELLPLIDSTIGGDPRKRILFGHSHGGSFALYALFAEAASQHSFSTYLASDASLGCMPQQARAWEQAYAQLYTDLPVRLHHSYATQGNFADNVDYAGLIDKRHYRLLVYKAQAYTGTHTGIVPQVLADGLGFALAP